MGTPYLGELRVISFNFPPKGWAFCNGQLLPINQNQALFSILGTTYGGNGQTTFGLPNLQGRTPLHTNSQFALGALGGEVGHTLITSEMPAHSHLPKANPNTSDSQTPGGFFWGSGGLSSYSPSTPASPMSGNAIASAGGSQAHPNIQPYLVVNVIIALQGIFPSRN
jgi:microcystin-dependent protein